MSFIPKSEGFYYYETKNECGDIVDVVVYHKDDGYVGITKDTNKNLDKLISKHNYKIKEHGYKYNVNDVIKEGFDSKKHEINSKKIHRHEADDPKGRNKLPNELYEAVYKGDVDQLIEVIGGKKRTNNMLLNVTSYKWLSKHIFEYMYYMSGIIVLLIYSSATQTTVNDDNVNEAAAVLSDQFGKAAVRSQQAAR